MSVVATAHRRIFREISPAGPRRIKGWTWADWTIGARHQLYGTLTINAAGNAHFECVTYADNVDGVEPWRAGFSLETRDGVRVHAEPPHQGPPMRERDRARYRWSFDFTYEASNFERIARAVQITTR